jgi:hypothetical protein
VPNTFFAAGNEFLAIPLFVALGVVDALNA